MPSPDGRLRPRAQRGERSPLAKEDDPWAEAATRIVQLEEAEVALRRLESIRRTFISEAVHELNTPLTVLGVHVEALGDMDLSEAQRAHVVFIQRNLHRLVSLVRDMLAASRLETGRFDLDLADVALADVVDEAFVDVAEAAARGKVVLARAPMAGLRVRADRGRLLQVLQNLLANAIRFTPAGGRVHVDAAQEGRQVLVRVADTGLGLTPEQIGQLFQPFSRPHPEAGAPKGTGLGLFLAKGILEQHGGRIWAESEGPGRGAAFCFYLPAA